MAGPIDMGAASDDDLFLYMSFYDSAADHAIAEAAFNEFHRRYVTELYARCRGICHRLGQPDSVAEDLTALTLRRALQRAETYRGPGSSARTMAWLCTIARNALIDSNRNPNRPSLVNNVTETDLGAETYSAQDFAALYHEFQTPLPTRDHWSVVAAIFEELDERTQRVLLETLLQRSKSPGHSYMYRGTAKLLAEKLGVTPDNLRRIRHIGMKTIGKRLELHLSTRGTRHVTAR